MIKGFKLTVIGLSIAIVAILATTIVLLVTREKPLPTPNQPALIVVAEEKFLDVAPVEGATGYVFKIDNVEYESKENILRVTNVFAEARLYSVEVSAKANRAKNNSEFSETVQLKNKLLLSRPLLNYDTATKILSWSSSGSNATYDLYANGQLLETGLTTLSYNCSALMGEFSMSVKAVPIDDNFYLPSLNSANRNITVFQILSDPTLISFDENTGVLKFTPPTNAPSNAINYEVVYNGVSYISLSPIVQNNEVAINLSLLVQLTANPSVSVRALEVGYFLASNMTVIAD